MDSINNDYLDLFKKTAFEHIDQSQEILNLQSINNNQAEELFRHFHSLKGSSAIMKYEQISKLCNELLNLIDKTGNTYTVKDGVKLKIIQIAGEIKTLLLAI